MSPFGKPAIAAVSMTDFFVGRQQAALTADTKRCDGYSGIAGIGGVPGRFTG
jgi:hypothetical protein